MVCTNPTYVRDGYLDLAHAIVENAATDLTNAVRRYRGYGKHVKDKNKRLNAIRQARDAVQFLNSEWADMLLITTRYDGQELLDLIVKHLNLTWKEKRLFLVL